MDKFEAFPVKYDKAEVLLVDKDSQPFMAIAYVMNPSEFFVYPDEKYLTACALTAVAHYYLALDREKLEEFDPRKITFPVVNGITGDKVDTYQSSFLGTPQSSH